MTEDILPLMEQRRAFKHKNAVRCRDLNRVVKRRCSAAKEKWINEQCDGIEDLATRDTQMMYEIMKKFTGKRKISTGEAIMKRNGEIAMEKEEILDRWKEYIEEL